MNGLRVVASSKDREKLKKIFDSTKDFHNNLYGLILLNGIPIICKCRGSMFLCEMHANEFIIKHIRKQK